LSSFVIILDRSLLFHLITQIEVEKSTQVIAEKAMHQVSKIEEKAELLSLQLSHCAVLARTRSDKRLLMPNIGLCGALHRPVLL